MASVKVFVHTTDADTDADGHICLGSLKCTSDMSPPELRLNKADISLKKKNTYSVYKPHNHLKEQHSYNTLRQKMSNARISGFPIVEVGKCFKKGITKFFKHDWTCFTYTPITHSRFTTQILLRSDINLRERVVNALRTSLFERS